MADAFHYVLKGQSYYYIHVCTYSFIKINIIFFKVPPFLPQVDLLSLDVEGAEKQILDTLPWSTVEISVLLVEHHGDVKGKDTKFVESVEAHGYHLYDHLIDKDNIGDYIFVRNGFL